jgi:twitching motility protein PilT
VNIFSQRGSFSIVCRQLNAAVPTLTQLKLPEIFTEIPKEKTGLVLITGATGSGKSTTLAAILDEINRTKAVHIVTLEDPVEYLHKHQKATFNQRELGLDFDTYANGLRAALRQAPKVILVGEMRDRDTVKIALSAAETGHLVLSTLHTINAGETINRILGMFEPDEQEQVRTRLSDSLRWIASQRLVPRVSGGRFALIELMGSNLRIQETIRLGESEGKTFYEIIEANYPFGWRTFDNACLDAYEQGQISEETALLYCSKRSVVSRGIDNLKKARGEMSASAHTLRMKNLKAGGDAGGVPAPPLLKVKK